MEATVMATLQRRSEYPNVLLITGTDVVINGATPNTDDLVSDWRQRVKSLLFSDTNGIRNFSGEVDFIICYVNRGQDADHKGVDHAITPRPLRGIVRLPGWDLSPSSNLGGLLSGGIGHEVGHYWLVPGAAQIITPNGPVPTPTPDQVAESLNRGAGLPPFSIMGRTDYHWSPYIHSQDSPMDGINHSCPETLLEQEHRYAYALGQPTTGVTFELPGQGQITTPSRYSDLELYLMGVLKPPEFQPANAGMRVLRATWVYPADFQAGLYLESNQGQKWYLGFDQGPHRLRAQSTDGSTSQPVYLRVPFNPADLVATRAVQRSNTLLLQVRIWGADGPATSAWLPRLMRAIPFAGVLRRKTSLSCTDILGDVPAGQLRESSDPYTGWNTLLTLNGRAKSVGIGGRHLGGVCFARMRAELCGERNGAISPIPFSRLTGINLIDQATPLFAKTLLGDGSFVLQYRTSPGGVASLQHSASVDHAPRLTMPTTSGDFSFGAWLKLLNCCIVTWAGGSGVGKNYIGVREGFRFDQFDVSPGWGATTTIRQAPPPQNTYKFLFCFMSQTSLPDSILLPKLTRLDLNRRAWEPCFNAMMQGQRRADTSIP
jgi:hypothetical protein